MGTVVPRVRAWGAPLKRVSEPFNGIFGGSGMVVMLPTTKGHL